MAFDYDSIEQQLRLAAESGDDKQVRVLLEQGANINAAPVSGMTALRLALKYRHLDIARLLLQRGTAVTLDDAQNTEQLRFLQDSGIEGIAPNPAYRRLLRRYERGTLSWEEVQSALENSSAPIQPRQTIIQTDAQKVKTGM